MSEKCGNCAKFRVPDLGCPWASEKSLAPSDKACDEFEASKESKIKYVPTPTVLTLEFLAEEVWDRKTNPKFLRYDFSRDSFSEVTEIDLNETDNKGRRIIYVPVDNSALRKGLVILPSGATETTFKQLFEEADGLALSCYDPIGQEPLIRLLTRVSVASWFLDRFTADAAFDVAGAGKFAPLVPIRGPSQSGKNRLAFVLRMLSYRPYFEMSTYRVPSLYRPLDVWRGTLVLDEADFSNTSEKSELVHYLNCRATGTPVSRQDPKNPRITHTFYNFGLTILTQRKQFDDNATESRCLPFYSEKTEKQLPTVETDEMLKRGLELQNQLLFLRFKFFKKVEIDKSAWIEGLSDHRLIASLLPLLALSKHEPSVYDTITETGKQIEALKIEEKANSEDGIVTNLLWEKIQNDLFELWNNPLYYVLEQRELREEGEGGEREVKKPLTVSMIAEDLKWSTYRLRKTIRGLSLHRQGTPNVIKVGKKSWRIIFFEPEKLEKKLREFVVGYKPKELYEKLKVTEVTQVTDFIRGVNGKEKDAPCKNNVTSVTSVTSEGSLFCELCGNREAIGVYRVRAKKP